MQRLKMTHELQYIEVNKSSVKQFNNVKFKTYNQYE